VIRIISIFFIIIFFSCENDLKVNAEWQDIPVIYGILDPGSYYEDNNEHYIRIQKSFLGNLAASEMAQQSDSIYYNNNNIEVTVERIEDNNVLETFILEPVFDIIKEDGYFSNENHQVYKFNEELTVDGDPLNEYRISFYNSNHQTESSSITKIVEPIRIRKYPTSNPTNPNPLIGDIQFGEDNPQEFIKDINIKPSKNAKMYSLSLRFNYIEFNTQFQTRDTLHVDWTFSPKTATEFQLSGGPTTSDIEFNINVNDFYKYLASTLNQPDNNTYRYPIGVYYQGTDGAQIPGIKYPCIELYFEALNLDLYNYIISSSDPGLVENRPVFNNITNGAGLFASKSSHNVTLKFDNSSNDSLSFGRFTKDLNFLYFSEIGQGISAFDSNGVLINYTD